MMSTSLQLLNTEVVIQNYNNDFLLIRAVEAVRTASIGKAIYHKQFDFIDEVIVTEVEICLKLNASFDDSKLEAFTRIEIEKDVESQVYHLPVYFNEHEDWEQVEQVSKFSKEEIVSKLCKVNFSIAMFGFLPGFMYLNGLNKELHVPRKKVPSKYVEANSVAIGGKYLGLYAIDSPGGWHVIGKTPFTILQISQMPPVALNLGDLIKLEAINLEEYNQFLKAPLSLKEYNAKS